MFFLFCLSRQEFFTDCAKNLCPLITSILAEVILLSNTRAYFFPLGLLKKLKSFKKKFPLFSISKGESARAEFER